MSLLNNNNSSSSSSASTAQHHLHHQQHLSDQACLHHHHQQQQHHQYHHHNAGEERQSGRRASRGGGLGGGLGGGVDGLHPPPPPPPPPHPQAPHPPPALDANGADAKMEDNEENPELDGPMTTTTLGHEVTSGHEVTTGGHEVTYIDDEDDDDIAAAAENPVDRDPFRWNEIVKVKFDDIFGEPDSEIFSFESVWKISSKVYKTTKLWCYRLLSLTFVVPLAVLWGVVFSCLSFSRVWICVPLLKASDIQLHCFRRLFEALLRTFLAPCFEAVGRCLYHIRLRIIRGDESL